MTDVSEMQEGARGLNWHDVDGETEKGQFGGAVNRVEARLVADTVAEMSSQDFSVGVVTPFAAQARLIEEEVRDRVDGEMLKTIDFVTGTAHKFQGGQRQIILFSTVIAPNTSPRSAAWIEENRNLLNVAASRAQNLLTVFGHPTASDDLGVPTLTSLRASAIAGLEPSSTNPYLIHSGAEKLLLDELRLLGFDPILKVDIEGYEVDFLLQTDDAGLVIEVDGSHHFDVRGVLRKRDVARDRVLAACGYTTVRFPDWRCREEPANVALEVQQAYEATARRS